MRFYNLSTKKYITIPDSKVKMVVKTVDCKGNLGVRKITRASAVSPQGHKLSKIISSEFVRKSK